MYFLPIHLFQRFQDTAKRTPYLHFIFDNNNKNFCLVATAVRFPQTLRRTHRPVLGSGGHPRRTYLQRTRAPHQSGGTQRGARATCVALRRTVSAQRTALLCSSGELPWEPTEELRRILEVQPQVPGLRTSSDRARCDTNGKL